MRGATLFEVPVPELIAGLERIGTRLCQYGGGEWIDRRCDCKYGATFKGEDGGCPEIRLAIHWLRSTADPGAASHAAADRRQAISILRAAARQATEFADELEAAPLPVEEESK